MRAASQSPQAGRRAAGWQPSQNTTYRMCLLLEWRPLRSCSTKRLTDPTPAPSHTSLSLYTQVVDLNTQSLQYVCEALIPQASEITSGLLPSDPDPSLTLAGVLSLHSRPGASKVILLDFDGHVTTGTKWNAARNDQPITTPAYDVDKDPSSFRWVAAAAAAVRCTGEGGGGSSDSINSSGSSGSSSTRRRRGGAAVRDAHTPQPQHCSAAGRLLHTEHHASAPALLSPSC